MSEGKPVEELARLSVTDLISSKVAPNAGSITTSPSAICEKSLLLSSSLAMKLTFFACLIVIFSLFFATQAVPLELNKSFVDGILLLRCLN